MELLSVLLHFGQDLELHTAALTAASHRVLGRERDKERDRDRERARERERVQIGTINP